MADEAKTGNSVVDSIFGTLRGVVGIAGDALNTAATFQERVLAAKVAAAQKTAAPQQLVTSPTSNPNASDAARLKMWATYTGITGGVLLVMLLLYKKVK